MQNASVPAKWVRPHNLFKNRKQNSGCFPGFFALCRHLGHKKCGVSHISHLMHPYLPSDNNGKTSGSDTGEGIQRILKIRLSIPPRNPGILRTTIFIYMTSMPAPVLTVYSSFRKSVNQSYVKFRSTSRFMSCPEPAALKACLPGHQDKPCRIPSRLSTKHAP